MESLPKTNSKSTWKWMARDNGSSCSTLGREAGFRGFPTINNSPIMVDWDNEFPSSESPFLGGPPIFRGYLSFREGRILHFFATNNSNLASSFCLDQTYQSRFMSLLMNGPIISSYQLLIISSAISNNTQLNTFIFQISVQPDNHPPEMLQLQVFWKVDFPKSMPLYIDKYIYM